jgi:hypothetical protein
MRAIPGRLLMAASLQEQANRTGSTPEEDAQPELYLPRRIRVGDPSDAVVVRRTVAGTEPPPPTCQNDRVVNSSTGGLSGPPLAAGDARDFSSIPQR